jgi:mRNA interferase MazF
MLEAGTIVLIPFPYSDLSNAKKRPVLMLTQPDAQGDFVGMPLTTKYQSSPALQIAAGPLKVSGMLVANSWVKTDTVFSLCESQITKVLGCVAQAERTYCVQHLCAFLNKGQ